MTNKKGWLGPYAPTDRHADQTTLQELVRLRKVNEKYRWQPIETAPKDGTPILIYSGLRVDVPLGHVDHEKSIYISSFDGDWWIWDGNFGAEYAYEPTHWMNLPEPPK